MTADGTDTPGGVVVVTGGAGFLGASVVRALEGAGEHVRVIDDGRSCGFGYLEGTAAEIVDADILDAGSALRGARAVLHLAARTSVPASIDAPVEDFMTNVVGTVTLLEAARRAGVARFVLASSSATVGRIEPPLRETTFPRPIAPYGAAKLAAEAYQHAFHVSYGTTTVSVRLSNMYGPYSLHKESVVHRFIRDLLAGRPITIYGSGHQTRDLVYVGDVVNGLLAVLAVPEERIAARVIPLGSGRETSLLEVAEALFTVAGRRVPIVHEPPRAGDVPRSALDIETAQYLLGYRPGVALEEGLARTLAWFEDALATS